MKHGNRILSLLLTVCLLAGLLSGLTVGVQADVVGENITDQSSAEYRETMSTISYAEYKEQYTSYFSGKEGAGSQVLTFDATDRLVFRDGKRASSSNVITIEGDAWTLTTPKGEVYTSVEDAVAAGFTRSDLVYV
ncbi:MAG: hypothetical protein IJT18_05400, partial [Oscillospiraceae bacterium]|nr:hypothetical protein [Oscillospiraceae bacterium]